MNYLIIFSILACLGWVYYQIQDRIGKEQARDWEVFKRNNPQYFRKENTDDLRKE